MMLKTASKISALLLVIIALAALMPVVIPPATAANPDTQWVPDQMVSADTAHDDRRPSVTTGKNGCYYVAYEHYNVNTSKYEIKVANSTDGGVKWSVMHTISTPSLNLFMPSIAVDPYTGELYVVFELEFNINDYDIYLNRYDGAHWWTESVDTDGEKNRFPSIAVEYDHGSGNSVYIVYERQVSSISADVCWANSTDHGDTWTHKTLADYGFMCHQPSIAYADGYVYVAYRVGNSTHGQIDLKYSSNGGSTWTTKSNISNQGSGWAPKPCSEPSIAATHGGGVVVAAWIYAESETNDDIRYSYSTDHGATWSISLGLTHPSPASNERYPHLAVDGIGYARNFVSNIHITYEKQETVGSRTNGVYHRQAHAFDLLDATRWSSAVQVADDDAKISWLYPTYVDRSITTRGETPLIVFMDFWTGTEGGTRGDYDIYATTIGGKTTVDTSPSGLKVRIDGVDYITPVSFWWAYLTYHPLEAYSPQGSHAFVRWSDGLEQTHPFFAHTVNEELVVAYYTPTLTLNLSPNPVARGSPLTISGQLTPGKAASISLYYRTSTSNPWAVATTMNTNAAGAYSVTVPVPWSLAPGIYDLVAVWWDSVNNRYAVSNVKRLVIT